MRVLFSTGEASGDAYAAAIASEMQALYPGRFAYEGIGGRKSRAAGIRLLADSSDWGAIGVLEVIRIFGKAWRGRAQAKVALADGKPGIFVPIDYGYMNLQLCRFARAHGWKVVYFCPPGGWRRDRQGPDLPELTDAIVALFSWSADILNEMGARAYWFGHPIKQILAEQGRAQQAGDTVAVLPGSRIAEVRRLLPILAESLRGLDRVCEFAVAPLFDPELMRADWLRLVPERTGDRFLANDVGGVLHRARAGLICSGTATLEAAVCRCPHVVVYQAGKMTEIQARLFLGMREGKDFIAQPNIFLQRQAVPELYQHKAEPRAIRAHLEQLLMDGPERAAQLEAFEEIDAMLGPNDAITQTAKLLAEESRRGA